MVALALALWLGQAKEPPFYQDIQKFLISDKKNPPAKGQILFIGSSSFTRWTDVATYFPKLHILNRGFGGSSLPDVIRYQDQIIYPYQPRQIVIYCGENDIAGDAKISAYDIYQRFVTLYQGIRRHTDVPVAYISAKPSPSRWAMRSKFIALNGMIHNLALEDKSLTYVDVWEPMLDKDRRPIAENYVEDNLHMNAKGYKIWQKVLEPILLPEPKGK